MTHLWELEEDEIEDDELLHKCVVLAQVPVALSPDDQFRACWKQKYEEAQRLWSQTFNDDEAFPCWSHVFNETRFAGFNPYERYTQA
eukprot:CAMPEP_0175964056 /NCGR_PEP_ID=MMETSP0108-20121206/37354_1 /TAXON_ID=195067 ORGANISM="Goniomonas pacifica, Strain CCMP1869" /NCGR_SAMPLE_ID=MMETSP0108 /ASSEMBLY_ACC=CAM_ASM_000204 /LENGTH=86 /DNA_ID=CAMNT_0017292005 /DNA_START=15 /DNA_END=272 /DNA_ORIENTATION=-